MKKWMLAAAAAVVLSGCAHVPSYQSAVKAPPPASLVGYWQSVGPQRGLVSKEAIASLIINADGDTLDCRQWQRVIAKPGRVTQFSDDWVNINIASRMMPLTLKGGDLHYDKLVLQRVKQPTTECQDALAHLTDAPAVTPDQAASVGGKPHHKSTLRNSKF
ncbi:lipoprotein [Erwinia tracheiphila]|uniref:Lipoprotein n=1 Tax=Erwinia tracheiphila TaxID=65700 RepID=A0A345CQ60_9GAMM|nr:lipoprotein YedD [Erwinia tracheiphila]AXF75577.1 lipoprotein [Erwinia tracheiphila]UIA81875.1 lipoprotein [Erwinia tracheiphila]UIA90471.1 lipoprotein [Erwinia tracheiphila]